MKKNTNTSVIYQTPNGALSVAIDTKAETVWLSLQQIAELFGTDKSGISRHIRNIFSSGELERD